MILAIVGGRLCRGSLPTAALENLTIWSNKPSALWPADRVVHRWLQADSDCDAFPGQIAHNLVNNQDPQKTCAAPIPYPSAATPWYLVTCHHSPVTSGSGCSTSLRSPLSRYGYNLVVLPPPGHVGTASGLATSRWRTSGAVIRGMQAWLCGCVSR